MGLLSKEDKLAIRRGAWCNDPGIPEHLQKHHEVQVRHKDGLWIGSAPTNADDAWKRYGALDLPKNLQARILCRGKVLASK